MNQYLHVTPSQVLAAKLALELSKEAGEVPDEALKAIANARVVIDDERAGMSELEQRREMKARRAKAAERSYEWAREVARGIPVRPSEHVEDAAANPPAARTATQSASELGEPTQP